MFEREKCPPDMLGCRGECGLRRNSSSVDTGAAAQCRDISDSVAPFSHHLLSVKQTRANVVGLVVDTVQSILTMKCPRGAAFG